MRFGFFASEQERSELVELCVRNIRIPTQEFQIDAFWVQSYLGQIVVVVSFFRKREEMDKDERGVFVWRGEVRT